MHFALFGKKKPAEEVTQTLFRVLPGVSISGGIETLLPVLVEGEVIGDIRSKGKLVIAKDGYVHGNIEANNVVVFGRVNGNVSATKHIVVEDFGFVDGTVSSPDTVIHPRAIVSNKDSERTAPRQVEPLPVIMEPPVKQEVRVESLQRIITLPKKLINDSTWF